MPDLRARASAGTWWGVLSACVVGILGIASFYRWFFASGFDIVQGDVGDGRFTAAVAAHWAAPFTFAGGPLDLGIFFPVTSSLGYSDTMFAFGVLAAPLIHAGVDSFVAVQWAYITATAVGYAAAVAVLRLLRVPWVVSIPAAFLIVFSNAMQLASLHPQLLAFTLIPVIALLVVLSLRAGRPRTAMLWGAGSGLAFAVMTFTSFFTGWAVVVTGSLAVVLLVVIRWAARRPIADPLRSARWTIDGVVAGALPLIPALLWTYGDVLRSGQVRTAAEVAGYLLEPREIVNVSGFNLVWGQAMTALGQDTSRMGEWWYAPTPWVLMLAIGAGALGIARARHARGISQVGTSLILAALITMLLPVRVGEWSAWSLLMWLPGTNAIRAAGRVEVIAAIALAFGIALVVGEWLRERRPRPWLWVAVACVGLLLMIEQSNSYTRQQTALAQMDPSRTLSAPPAGCTSFVFTGPFPDAAAYQPMTAAQVLAQRFGIPTWNGYSGGVPDGWALSVFTDDYDQTVESWRRQNGITDYCTLNLVTQTWTRITTAP